MKYVALTCSVHEAPRTCVMIGRIGPGIAEILHMSVTPEGKFIPAGIYSYEQIKQLLEG